MSFRLLPLAPLAPVAAIVIFAAANAAAQARGANEIRDVQIGEAGDLMRVAVVCRDDCRLAARAGGKFFLPGVDASLEIDLAGRARLASALVFTPGAGGSELSIVAPADVRRASIRPCEAGAARATCIDLDFAPAGDGAAPAGNGQQTERPPGPSLSDAAPANAAPALRDAPEEPRLVFARYAPPERFDPPSLPQREFAPPGQRPAQSDDARRPIIVEEVPPPAPREIDIRESAGAILDRRFGVAECEGARARLRADAWALEAMVDVGFCDAIAGRLEEADGVFSRLLAYTPDNYQAHVGRALVAARTGERALARRHFQDALNALPPIVESDRIVEAMDRL